MSDRCVICGNLPSQHNGLACSRDRGQILFSASDLADLIASRVVAALRVAILSDSDGSPKGRDAEERLDAKRDSADPKGIAQGGAA